MEVFKATLKFEFTTTKVNSKAGELSEIIYQRKRCWKFVNSFKKSKSIRQLKHKGSKEFLNLQVPLKSNNADDFMKFLFSRKS